MEIASATRFENGRRFRCEALNDVMRERKEPAIHATRELEVWYPPIVHVEPSNVTVVEGTKILLKCNYESNPSSLTEVIWFIDNKRIDTNNTARYEGGSTDQQALIITKSTGKDMGNYSCLLANAVGNGTSEGTIDVNILYKPKVSLTMSSPSPILETDHKNVTLTCEVVAGNPRVLEEVIWYLDGEVLKHLPECNGTDGEDNLCNEVDPSMLLLQDTTKSFHGNYSCKGKNSAGWGPESRKTELVVYYPPGPAKLTYSPWRVVKGKSLLLTCSIQETGRPEANRFRWHRGGRLVTDIVASSWLLDPVSLDHRTNFSCRGFNLGGDGDPSYVSIDVMAPPSFKKAMNQYSGALYKSSNISLTCTVECAPLCSVQWLKNGEVIDPEKTDRYYVVERKIEPQVNRNDFEATESTLYWNMTAWPGHVLGRDDTARYMCRSSRNDAGPGVNSTTKFAVEYEPENITVTPTVVQVIETEIPGKVVCQASGFPVPSYSWRRQSPSKSTSKEHSNSSLVLSSSNTLLLPPAQRKDAGNYVCEAYNRHGAVSTSVFVDVLFVPECGIKQIELDGWQVLQCSAHANPSEVSFTWKLKNDNDSLTDEKIWKSGQQSYLRLSESVDVYRTYLCYANNSVGISRACERDIPATPKVWWRDQQQLILFGGIALAVLVLTVILCIIIICVCRRMRAKSKCPPTNGVDSAANGQLGTDNPGLYENLPFHGLQQAPNKPVQAIQPRVVDTRKTADGIEALQKQLTTNPSFTPRIVSCPPFVQSPLSYQVGSPSSSQYSYGMPVISPIQPMYPALHQTVLLNACLPPMQPSFLKQFPTIDEESEPETRKFASLNTRNSKKPQRFQSMRAIRKRNIERFYPNTEYGENFNEINNNKDNQDNSDREHSIYANYPAFLNGNTNISGVEAFENLTDSIQVCELPDEPVNLSTESLNRPVPAPRTKITPYSSPTKTDHVYMNLSMPLINTTKFFKSHDVVDAPVRPSRSVNDLSKPIMTLPRRKTKDDEEKKIPSPVAKKPVIEKAEASILDEDANDENENDNDVDEIPVLTKPNIIGATPKKNTSIILPSTSLVKSVDDSLKAGSKQMNRVGLPVRQIILPDKTLKIPKLQEKSVPKKSLVRRSNSVQSNLTVSLDSRQFQPVRVDKRIPVDQERMYNNTIGPLIYQPADVQYYTKTLNRSRDKNEQKLSRLKKSESLREKLSCVGVYDHYQKPDYPEQDCSEPERRSYLQLLKGNYISNSTRNLGPEFYNPNYNKTLREDRNKESKHKKLVYADLALGNHNLKFKNTVNSNRHLYDTYSIPNADESNREPNQVSNTNQRKSSHGQPRSEYATLKFNEIDPFQLDDQLIYADADLKDYGPINYKAASIYSQMKKIKEEQRMQEIYEKNNPQDELL
ncbi:hypothetical protein JYU34_022059 [Plutella xylostella]|uniref:Ig-like domain-containing protein n=1 Tax=Plutella xylostella TaxID=51655 RepID=A0ABQ7PQ55_PLUXY|nr:hypothetical protein JYU34_022059 [Plutella xylostella]